MKADIFFFITSVSVVTLTILLAWVLVYIIGVLRDLKDVSRTVKKETKNIADDISELRSDIKAQGFGFRHFTKFIGKMKNRKKGRQDT